MLTRAVPSCPVLPNPMSTTALIVEIVVIGLLAIASGMLNFYALYFLDGPTIFRPLLDSVKGQQAFSVALLLAAAYPAGMVVNCAAYDLSLRAMWGEKKIRTCLSYELTRARVLQTVSDSNSRFIFEAFSMVRVLRASALILVFSCPWISIAIMGPFPTGSWPQAAIWMIETWNISVVTIWAGYFLFRWSLAKHRYYTNLIYRVAAILPEQDEKGWPRANRDSD